MAIPTSKTAICNLALDYLSQEEIVTNIDTPSTQTEVVCSRWYDVTRREVLRGSVWNFAKTRTTLSLNSSSPAFGYDDAYNLPNDFLRLLLVTNGDDLTCDRSIIEDYEIEGKQILINNGGANSLFIIYIKDETNVSKYDALFVKALALSLALNIAYKFTLKDRVVNRVKALLTETLQKARSIDGQERPPRIIDNTYLSNVRRNMSSSSTITNAQYYSFPY